MVTANFEVIMQKMPQTGDDSISYRFTNLNSPLKKTA